MVTGVETAGLILAVLPLIVEGLKAYQQGVKRLKQSWKYDSELKKLLRQVKEQKIFLEDNLAKLLSAACPALGRTHHFGEDDWEVFWSQEVDAAVMDYFGEKRYDLFEELLEDFEDCLLKLPRELDRIQGADKKDARKKSFTLSTLRSLGVRHFSEANPATKRIQLFIREEEVADLTKELESLNRRMDKLLANRKILSEQVQESKLITEPDARNAFSLASLLHQIRLYADRLFHAFHETWAGECHVSHDAMLFLDTPISLNIEKFRLNVSSFQFRLMLRRDEAETPKSPSWHEANITVFDEEFDATGLDDRSSMSSSLKQVKHQISPKILISPTTPSTHEPAREVVVSLCNDVTRAKEHQKCLDLQLRRGKSFLCREMGHWPLRKETSTWEIVNLEQLLSQEWRISPRQKVVLGFKLAASLLQLKTSQWLRPTWSNQAIHFKQANPVDADQPLILRSFPDQAQQDFDFGWEHKPRLMFLELGILLMEIHTQKPFLQFAKEQCGDQEVHASMRQSLANDWYESTFETMTKRYGKVVTTCINFVSEYSEGLPSWDDEQLRMTVCAKIIGPLMEECKTLPGR